MRDFAAVEQLLHSLLKKTLFTHFPATMRKNFRYSVPSTKLGAVKPGRVGSAAAASNFASLHINTTMRSALLRAS